MEQHSFMSERLRGLSRLTQTVRSTQEPSLTRFHPQLMHNAVTWIDDKNMIPKETPHPGLLGTLNRTFLGSWNEVEKKEGERDWTLVDALFRFNHAQGRKLVVCFTKFPKWTNDRANKFDLFANFLAEFNERYKDYDYEAEAGNEIEDMNTEYNPWYERFVDIAHFWATVREAFISNPRVRVFFGSVQSLGPKGMGIQHINAAYSEFRKLGVMRPHGMTAHVYEIPGFQTLADFTPRLSEFKGWMISVGLADTGFIVSEYGRYTIGTGAKMHVDLTSAEKQEWHRDSKRAILAVGGVMDAIFWELDNGDRLHGGFGWDVDKDGSMTTARIDWNASEDVLRYANIDVMSWFDRLVAAMKRGGK